MSETKHCYLHGKYIPINGGCPRCDGMISSPKDLTYVAVGQIWWVKLPGGTTLAEREIKELTDKTVVLTGSERYDMGRRYKTTDIEFVELKEDPDVENAYSGD